MNKIKLWDEREMSVVISDMQNHHLIGKIKIEYQTFFADEELVDKVLARSCRVFTIMVGRSMRKGMDKAV